MTEHPPGYWLALEQEKMHKWKARDKSKCERCGANVEGKNSEGKPNYNYIACFEDGIHRWLCNDCADWYVDRNRAWIDANTKPKTCECCGNEFEFKDRSRNTYLDEGGGTIARCRKCELEMRKEAQEKDKAEYRQSPEYKDKQRENRQQRRQRERQERKAIVKVCANPSCGKEFRPKRSDAQTCSEKCQKQMQRAK